MTSSPRQARLDRSGSTGYVTLMGAPTPSHSGQPCFSSRLEAAPVTRGTSPQGRLTQIDKREHSYVKNTRAGSLWYTRFATTLSVVVLLLAATETNSDTAYPHVSCILLRRQGRKYTQIEGVRCFRQQKIGTSTPSPIHIYRGSILFHAFSLARLSISPRLLLANLPARRYPRRIRPDAQKRVHSIVVPPLGLRARDKNGNLAPGVRSGLCCAAADMESPAHVANPAELANTATI